MSARGFRQSNAWLHTWAGLLLGWLLYAVFFTGTLSFFQEEISVWMKPEQHGSNADGDTAQRAVQALAKLAPEAASWSIRLPGERNNAVQVQWFDRGQEVTRGGGQRLTLDAASGEPLPVRETRGGGFLYRFHFELYGLPRLAARWIVGIATMVMLVAIVSGVITHKKIFRDFFTFRGGKGQRSWLDAHNATAVLALPFHLMITYSGLLLLMFMLMPWGVESAYQGDLQQYFAESGRGGRGGGGRPFREGETRPAPVAAPLTDLAPLLAGMAQRWPRGIAAISVEGAGTTRAVIELREQGGDSLFSRGGERLRFNGVTGAPLPARDVPVQNGATATYNVLTGLHLIRFAGPPLRWLFFLSGVAGTAMVATGLILWVVKRLPERHKRGVTPRGHRLVEALNVAVIAGLPLALAGYLWANRLLPTALAQRADWEIRVFFLVWAGCLLHALLRPHRRAWGEQLGFSAALFALLPLFSLRFPHSHLAATLAQGQWLVAGMDLTLIGFAALSAFAAWRLRNRGMAPMAARRVKTNTAERAAA